MEISVQNSAHLLRFDAALLPRDRHCAYVRLDQPGFHPVVVPTKSLVGNNTHPIDIDGAQAEILLVNQPYGLRLSEFGGSATLMPSRHYPGGWVLSSAGNGPTIWIDEVNYDDLHVRQNTMNFNMPASHNILNAGGLGKFFAIEPNLLTLCDTRPAIGSNRIALKSNGNGSLSATIPRAVFDATGLELAARLACIQIDPQRFVLEARGRIEHYRHRADSSDPMMAVTFEIGRKRG
jgi:hypothetical protein